MIIHTSSQVTRLFIIFVLLLFMGCAGALEEVDVEPRGVGYEMTVPTAGTRVVVWGNHSVAIDRVSAWLHERGVVIVDRTRLHQDLSEREIKMLGAAKDSASLLEAAARVGAGLVAFVEVSNVKEGQKFDLSQIRAAPSFSLTVDIRAVEPKTGEVVTQAKAWQTAPNQDPDLLIEGLTTRALHWAWQSPTSDGDTMLAKADIEEVQTPSVADAISTTEPRSSLTRKYADSPSPAGSTSFSDTRQEERETNTIALSDNPASGAIMAMPRASVRQQGNKNLNATAGARDFGTGAGGGEEVTLTQPDLSPENVVENSAKVQALTGRVESDDPDHVESVASVSAAESSPSVGSQVASSVLSILYTPAKLVYAGLGGFFGGLAYVLTAGDERTASTIWSASLKGDYYVTPAHLNGDTPLQFMGEANATVVNEASPDDPFVARSVVSRP